MTEVIVGDAEQNNDSHAVPHTSAGAALRQAREAKQMSVQALASALKVPAHKLQALEEDRWELLTDSVFIRSLALSVCRFLRIPAEPILAGLPKLEAAKLSANPEGINAPFKEKSLRSLMSSTPEPGAGAAAKAAVAAFIAIAGGAGLYFLPQWQTANDAQSEEVAQEQAQAAETVFMPQQAQAAAASVTASTTTEEPSAQQVLAAQEAAQPVAAPSADTANTSASSAGAASDSSKVSAPGGLAMRFVATAESWVQVRDAQGRVVMEKILQAGDVYQETATGRPFQVVVGNAGATQLEIDGAAFDLAASAKSNVARFEVK